MGNSLVLAIVDGVWWYRFSLLLFWVGLVLTVAFAVRAALLTRGDNTIRAWQTSYRAPNKRAHERRPPYQR